jgi:hypothetical protein
MVGRDFDLGVEKGRVRLFWRMDHFNRGQVWSERGFGRTCLITTIWGKSTG